MRLYYCDGQSSKKERKTDFKILKKEEYTFEKNVAVIGVDMYTTLENSHDMAFVKIKRFIKTLNPSMEIHICNIIFLI